MEKEEANIRQLQLVDSSKVQYSSVLNDYTVTCTYLLPGGGKPVHHNMYLLPVGGKPVHHNMYVQLRSLKSDPKCKAGTLN